MSDMKSKRQNKIAELIEAHQVETQDELADLLTAAGFQVTQATISRDIKEMKLIKISSGNGKQKYATTKVQEADLAEKYIRVLKDGFFSMESAQNLIVIKTVSGMAMAVAAALDELHIEGIIGSIAGDDTIMSATKNNDDAAAVIKKIWRLIRE